MHPQAAERQAAIDRAMFQIELSFRPERKARTGALLQGHRVVELVKAKRYSFAEACRLLDVSSKDVNDALSWLIEDNEALNARFQTEVYFQRVWDHQLAVWFETQEAMRPTAQIISFSGVA